MFFYFSEPFLRKYTTYLREEYLTILLLNHAAKQQILRILTDGNALTTLLEELSNKDKESYKILASKVDSIPFHHIDNPNEISAKLLSCKSIDPGVLKQLNIASKEDVQFVCYDRFQTDNWRNKLTEVLEKPIITEKDIINEKFFLFQINTHTIKLDEKFNWSEILTPILFPFKVIRILDPYLFKHIKTIQLDDILQILCKKSKSVEIEIISNSRKLKKESDLYNTVLPYFKDLSQKLDHVNIKVYTERRTALKRFHRRVIWTDYWAAHLDWGFDFLQKSKTSPGVNVTTSTNDIFITGRYKSADSNWNDIDDQWGQYINDSNQLHF